jgi:hypothetical protein
MSAASETERSLAYITAEYASKRVLRCFSEGGTRNNVGVRGFELQTLCARADTVRPVFHSRPAFTFVSLSRLLVQSRPVHPNGRVGLNVTACGRSGPPQSSTA